MRNLLCFVMSSALMLAACNAVDPASGGDVGYRTQASITENSITENALDINALHLSTLNLHALDAAALDPTALAALQDPGSNGTLARQFVEYATSCALASSQAFSFSWTDTAGTVRQERYPGRLGLAPYWAGGPLIPNDERWISACLAARVNWYGLHVTLSARSPGTKLPITETERTTFTIQEGAFFGNLFGTNPAIYACDNPDQVAAARAHYRDCAAGHVNADGSITGCGIIQRLGSCLSWCTDQDPTGGYYSRCRDPQGTERGEIVTIFLQ
jgi:hypothetical protein